MPQVPIHSVLSGLGTKPPGQFDHKSLPSDFSPFSQVYPASIIHTELHPSPFDRFPSSHSSSWVLVLSPQVPFQIGNPLLTIAVKGLGQITVTSILVILLLGQYRFSLGIGEKVEPLSVDHSSLKRASPTL